MTGRARVEHPLPLSEADWQRRVMDAAKAHGWRVAHFRPARTQRGNWITPMAGHPGFPDLVLGRGGVVICAELKSQRGQLGPGQAEWLDALGEHGRLWRPSDWPTVLAVLSGADTDEGRAAAVRVDLGGRTVYTGLLGEDTDEEPCDYCPDGMPCLCASDSVDPLD